MELNHDRDNRKFAMIVSAVIFVIIAVASIVIIGSAVFFKAYTNIHS